MHQLSLDFLQHLFELVEQTDDLIDLSQLCCVQQTVVLGVNYVQLQFAVNFNFSGRRGCYQGLLWLKFLSHEGADSHDSACDVFMGADLDVLHFDDVIDQNNQDIRANTASKRLI